MKVVQSNDQARAALRNLAHPIGLVPTMGFLHEGHLSLIERARLECATVAVSIFVNPTQFGPGEDYERYPRDMARDLDLCERAGVDLFFTPSTEELYPEGFSTFVEVPGLQDRWEGQVRPGHFRGVATVVALLLRLVQPQRAYFGEKDYQQLQIVRRMAADLWLDVEIVACPIVRESDGLALSSRNIYLNSEDRCRAVALSEALRAAQEAVEAGERSAATLSHAMHTIITAADIVPDYAAVVDPTTLEPLEIVTGTARAILAGRLGGVRLIDNCEIIL